MTNIEILLFNTKYSLNYMNGLYSISGFDHIKTIRVKEEDIKETIEKIHSLNKEEFEDFMLDFIAI